MLILRKRNLQYGTLLFIFSIAIFWKLLLTHEYSILTYPDSAHQTYPWSQFIARTIHQGSFPFWDNYSDAGRSFIGEAQTGAFYPINLLMGSFKLNSKGSRATLLIEGFIVLHCFLGSLFMYWLCRYLKLSAFSSFVSALIFSYSGSVGVRAAAQVNILNSSIWLPLIFLFYLKSIKATRLRSQLLYANLTGLCLGLSFLAGHHQPPMYAGLALLFSTAVLFFSPSFRAGVGSNLNRISLLRQTFLIFVFAFCYSSLQLIPSLEYSKLAYRWIDSKISTLASDKIPYEIAGSRNALSPDKLILILFPYATAVENSPYLGVLSIFLILFSLRQVKRSSILKLSLLLGLLFLGLSLGNASVLHGLFYALVPGFDKGREACRIFLIAHFAFSLLAGFGCDAFCKPIPKNDRIWQSRVVTAFLILASIVCLTTFGIFAYLRLLLQRDSGFNVPIFACLLFFASSLLVAGRFYGILSLRTTRVLIAFVFLFDFHFLLGAQIKPKTNFDNKENFEPGQFYKPDEIIEFLQKQPGIFRVGFGNEFGPNNFGLVERIETLGGYGATRAKQYYDFLAGDPTPGGKLADLLNVKYMVSSRELPLPRVFQSGKIIVYENTGWMPRAWTVSHVITKESREIVPLVSQTSFDPFQTAFTEEDLLPLNDSALFNTMATSSGLDDTQKNTEAPRYYRRSPNRFEVEVDSPAPQLLVVSENWYPGWKAIVNGTPQKIYRANGTLMGVLISPGHSQIDFIYRPTHFTWSVFLTVAALLTLLATASLNFRRKVPVEA